MITVLFLLTTLCINYCYASEQYTWKQPAIGTQEEAQVIENFNRVQYKQSDNRFACDRALYNLMNDNVCFEQIKKEIQYRISERIDWMNKYSKLQGTDLSAYIPNLSTPPAIEKKKAWWSTKTQNNTQNTFQLKYTGTEIRALYSLEAEPSMNAQVSEEDLNKMYINRLVHRAQLYAQLYNQLNAIQEEKANISALHIELLFDVCEGLKPDNGDTKNLLKDKNELFKEFLSWKDRWLTARERLLVQGDQRLLNPINKPGLYTITNGASRTLLMPYPPYVNDNDVRQPNDDIEADASNEMEPSNEMKPSNDVVGSRTLYSSENSYHQDVPKHDVRFCDALFGFDVLYKADQAEDGTFSYCASEWITTDIGTDQEKNFGILGYTVNNTSYIAKVDLPKSSERQYCIHMPCKRVEQKVNILRLKMPLKNRIVEKASVCNCDDNKIHVVAYGVEHENMFLYASNNSLMKGHPYAVGENDKSKSVLIYQFKKPIKKIYVLNENVGLVIEKDNSLYGVSYAREQKIKSIPLSEQDIIDIAYDRASRKLLILTRDGVFSYECCVLTMNSENIKAPDALRPNSSDVDVQNWDMELKNCKKVESTSFNYDKHQYQSIYFRNGQIYLQCKPENKYYYNVERVLIYPPLSQPVENSDLQKSTTHNANTL